MICLSLLACALLLIIALLPIAISVAKMLERDDA
jgi:hypothetical protein